MLDKDKIPPLVLEFLVFWTVRVEYHFERVAISREHFLESVEVEVVSNVVDIDFAEEDVVFEVAEPLYPASFSVV